MLEEDGSLLPEQCVRKKLIQNELHLLYAEEELQWFQKSHQRWLLQGDQNSSYFHWVANGRRRKNNMLSLKDGEINIEGTDNLLKHATDFYKNLFGPAPGNLVPIDSDMWEAHENLSAQDNEDLCRPFTMEEVKEALFSMDINRAPGPDQIPVEFYQFCWEIVKYDIMRLFGAFFKGNLMCKDYTMALLPCFLRYLMLRRLPNIVLFAC